MIENSVVVAIVGLIVVVAAHIAVIARWTGKIDGWLISQKERIERLETEVSTLRAARHLADGQLQQHAGQLREHSRLLYHRRASDSYEKEQTGG